MTPSNSISNIPVGKKNYHCPVSLNFPVLSASDNPRKTRIAHVLKSEECLKYMKERKQEEAENREKRGQGNLEKKRLRNEERKRKSEELAGKRAEGPQATSKQTRGTMRKSEGECINTNRKKNRLDNTVFLDLCCVFFGSYDEDAGTDR